MARRVVIIAIVVFVAAAVLALLGWMASQRPPEWWAPPRADDAQAMAVAENLERRLSEEISRVRPDEAPWAVRLHESQLNAWLALRMPQWIAHTGQQVDAQAQVRLVDGAIEIAMRRAGAAPEGEGPVGVLRIRPQVVDGRMHAEVDAVGLGSLALPGGVSDMAVRSAESVLRAFSEEAGGASVDGQQTAALAAMLRGEATPARWSLGDGREVELRALELAPGELVVQCATVRR